jgi:hypothetical protein
MEAMMLRAHWIVVAVQFSALGICWAESPSSPGGRVEKIVELEAYRPFQEIERLGLFLTEPGKIELPNLRKARFINIDSDQVTAVSLPALESVSFLIVRGTGIETLELPKLKYANGTFRVQGTKIRTLDLESFRRAGQLVVTSNPELAGITTPFAHEFDQVTLANNPALGEEVQRQLQSLQVPLDTKAKPDFVTVNLRLRATSMRPTGHTHASFNTFQVQRTRRFVYPRYTPYFPMFRPFLGGYWGFRR